MRVFKSGFDAGRSFPGAVITIGKFDALHIGHQKLISLSVRKAKDLKAPCLVVTFDPAPDQFIRLYRYEPVLPLAKQVELLGKLGVDGIVFIPFDKALACLSPEAFARDVLALQIKPCFVLVGEDFCFGNDRAGRPETLAELGSALGFSVESVPLEVADGQKVTAARIRELIEKGDTAAAERLLGRPLES